MFSALRQGSTIYVLDKTDVPTLRKGAVLSVTAPMPRQGCVYGNPTDMTVDLAVDCGGTRTEFRNIPAGLCVANDGNVVLTETREAMRQEVEQTLAFSRQAVESLPRHNRTIASCEEMLTELDPQFAREREREAKITSLEAKIGGIESSLGEMRRMLSEALDGKQA